MAANRVCHFKLVLLGDSAVGKSCLVVRFVRDEFFEFQEPTIGGKILFVFDFFLEVILFFFSVLRVDICPPPICSCLPYTNSWA